MKGISKVVGVVALVAILGLAGISSVAAQELGGEWEPLAAGESRVVSFEYLGDGSQIEIRMYVDAVDNAAFSVWTPEQLRQLAAGEEVEPVGRGSVDPYTGCCLIWSGSFGEGGTYQVALDGVGSGTAYYQIEITGDSVWVLESDSGANAPEDGQTPEVGAETAEGAEAAASGVTGGTGPDDALTAGDEYVSLPVGETLWYLFECAGDGSEIEVWLDAEPDDSVTFSIWTKEQVKQWAAGEEVSPVGRGTANDYESGDLFWAGTFCIPGKYYIVIENGSAADASFQLGISGDVSP
jgi:hypothetical protein